MLLAELETWGPGRKRGEIYSTSSGRSVRSDMWSCIRPSITDQVKMCTPYMLETSLWAGNMSGATGYGYHMRKKLFAQACEKSVEPVLPYAGNVTHSVCDAESKRSMLFCKVCGEGAGLKGNNWLLGILEETRCMNLDTLRLGCSKGASPWRWFRWTDVDSRTRNRVLVCGTVQRCAGVV